MGIGNKEGDVHPQLYPLPGSMGRGRLMYCYLLKRLTAVAIISEARSTSPSVVYFPVDSRIVPRAHSMGTARARSVRDNSTALPWQAAPAEAASPSIDWSRAPASTPRKLTLSVFGIRLSGCPFIRTSAIARSRPSCRRSRVLFMRSTFAARSRFAASQAAPRPATPMTFSVPALLPVSWPAPCMNFSSCTPVAAIECPHALRGVELVPRNAQQVDAQLGRIDGDLACGLGRVGVHQDAPLAGQAGDLADRLDRPHLVVGMHDAHQDGSFRDGFFESLQVDDPVRIDGHIGDVVPVSGGQVLADLRDGGMFEGRGDDVVSPCCDAPVQHL